jgi:chromosome segregation ATPase
MTIDEITRTLQTIAENQAQLTKNAVRTDDRLDRLSVEVTQLTRNAVRTDDRLDRISVEMAQLTSNAVRIDEQLDRLSAEVARLTGNVGRTDERLDRLTDRLDKLSADVAQVTADIAQTDRVIVTLLQAQNRHEEEKQTQFSEILQNLAGNQLKNEERFADLAAAQLKYEGRRERLESSFQMLEEFVRNFRTETNGRIEGTDRSLERVAALQAENAEQVKALVASQVAVVIRPKARSVKLKTAKSSKKR